MKIKAIFLKLIILIVIFGLLLFYKQNEADKLNVDMYTNAYLYDGDKLVGVNTDEQALDLVESWNKVIEQKQIKDTDKEYLSTKVVQLPSIINYVTSEGKELDNIEYVKDKTVVLEEGYTLSIDGKPMYYFQTKSDLDWIIEKVLLAYLPSESYLEYFQSTGKFKPYDQGERRYINLEVINDITTTEGYVEGSSIVTDKEDVIYDLFHNSDENKQVNYVSDENSINDIKEAKNMSDIQFKLNNPEVPNNIVSYNGQGIITNDIEPKVKVVQTYTTSETETIEFDTVVTEDDTMTAGSFDIVQEGENGTKEVTYETQVLNGKEISTKESGEEVTEKPVHKEIRVGTKGVEGEIDYSSLTEEGKTSSRPQSSSGFIWPMDNIRITCEYMCYANHTGIDLGNYEGAPIYAVADGVVSTSGWTNVGYAYHVIIDHGNGVQTLYAHMCSQPSVSVGQYVQQGDVLGFEGGCGNAFGPHLHLEVRLNGTTVNPRGYLPTEL